MPPPLALLRPDRPVRVGREDHESDHHEHEGLHGVYKSPFPLDSANASRYKAQKQILALEDHIRIDPCPKCMNKHLSSAVAFLEEASGLDGGAPEDAAQAARVESLRGQLKRARWTTLGPLREIRQTLARTIGHV